MSDNPGPQPIQFLKNGDLVQKDEETNANVLIAHYNRVTGDLEFEEAAFAKKYINQVTAAIGTVNKGTEVSGLAIKTLGVKGIARDKVSKSAPPKPKRLRQYGDQTPALVQWYFDHAPQEAYIRYGVYLDQAGKPITRRVRRRSTEIIDDRSGGFGLEEMNEGRGQQVGPKRFEKGPIALVLREEFSEGIVARRATCMTYAPTEVVGGFSGDGDDEEGDGDGDGDQGGEE